MGPPQCEPPNPHFHILPLMHSKRLTLDNIINFRPPFLVLWPPVKNFLVFALDPTRPCLDWQLRAILTYQPIYSPFKCAPHGTPQVWASLPSFLGGLSLHLNHLIGSRVTNYDWPFGTLPLGLFGSNLDTRDLRHILGPILVISDIGHFLTIPGPFECFSENGWSQKIKVFSMKERSLPTLSN